MGAELFRHLEAAREVDHGLLEREQAHGPLPRRHAIVHGLVRITHGRSHGVVQSQLVHVAIKGSPMRPLRGDGDLWW